MSLLIIAWLGGALTILSPCILPILPFVFARTGRPFLTGTLPMLAGMAVTFAAAASLAAFGGGWVVEASDYGRAAAIMLLALFGLGLLSPPVANRAARPVVTLANRLLGEGADNDRTHGIRASLLLGVATGLLWTPCAGPILGLVLTGAALQGASFRAAFLLLSYAAGAATMLAIALVAGGRLLAVLKRFMAPGERLRQLLGATVLAGVAVIAFGLDNSLLARVSYASTTRLEQGLLDRFQPKQAGGATALPASDEGRQPFRSSLRVEGTAPALDGAVAWLNSKPLSLEALKGKVVLVDFWTYSCINCIRTLPYARAWAEKYAADGLVVLGVHAPEFSFEKKIGNVEKALRDFGIHYPVAIDNDYRLWNAFNNSYWPAFYLIDAEGRIRYHHFGEGAYRQTETAIQDLLREAGSQKAASSAVVPEARGTEVAADTEEIRSGETYLGYRQASNFASPEGLRGDAAAAYTLPELRLNQWGLYGTWLVGPEAITLGPAGGGIAYRFSARDLHLVLGPGIADQPVHFRVTLDGKAPGANHGTDTDAEGFGTIGETRLYQLVRQAGPVGAHTFEIRFSDPGVEAFAFTFG